MSPPSSFCAPIATGVGTGSVYWVGPYPEYYSNYSDDAFMIVSPNNFQVSLGCNSSIAGLEGIAVGIYRIITGINDTVCSGMPTLIKTLNAAAGATYTWPAPVINPPGSISGAVAQSSPTSKIRQSLVNNTSGMATATYTITPVACGLVGQPFAVTIAVTPSPQANTAIGFCGDTVVKLQATGGGAWSAWAGNPNPATIVNPNSDTTLATGLTRGDIYRFIRAGTMGCTDTVSVIAGLQDTILITTNKPIFCASDSAQICATSGFATYHWNTGETTATPCIEATDAGNYYVTATDNTGCTAQSNHLAIAVYPVPSVSIIVLGDTLTTFGQVSYHWIYSGTPIPGATNTVYIAHQPGLYTLEVTDTNGCTTISNPVTVTGITNLEEQNISIYPNPSVSNWQLTVGNELVGAKMEVYDEQGRVVFKDEVRTTKYEITAGSLPSGVYYLRISNDKVSVVRKLVKL